MFGMEMCHYNIDDGYCDAVVRSLRKGILDEQTYTQLKATSNISEFKLVLEDTDYGADIFMNQDASSDFEVTTLRKAMREKLMSEIEFMMG